MYRPAVLRLLYADETCNAQCIRRRTVAAQLRFLLSTLLLDMTHDATDRFMRDSICCRYSAERFFLLHHTMYDYWPKVSGDTVVRMFRPLPRMPYNRRNAALSFFIFGQKAL